MMGHWIISSKEMFERKIKDEQKGIDVRQTGKGNAQTHRSTDKLTSCNDTKV